MISRSMMFMRMQKGIVRGSRAFCSSGKKQKVDFGYEDINFDEKEDRVKEVFHKVANNYDLMNDVTSIGIHRLWKNYFVSQIGPMRKRPVIDAEGNPTEEYEPMKILDVAGGTGDIAFLMHEEVQKQRRTNANAAAEITISDINSSMLGVGMDRAKERGYTNFNWLEANAESIPSLKNDSFDLYTISFGIRNVTDRLKALKEAHRILRRGGRFMCLEFSEVKIPVWKEIYDVYSMNIIPFMGQIILNDSASYQYLAESIRKFPNQDQFASLIKEAGFKHVTYENLSGGICSIHSGYKL
ncbi:unnamed protein product [Moneuplotes crassus]|uniref:2-methoxy-6-polyprenyl-1,4-benzoquinol methylase, mitochondrial n=3 Tax=Euplotes crassus TaxID=5936 RepID=A0AAD2D122_EUPCR|nr:unnamed protein product [Moneuplotes crassus]